jgi:phenylacetate-CoA ligase
MHYSLEKWLRRNAYFIMALRDGYPDVLKYRKEYLNFALSTNDEMEYQSIKKVRNIIKHAYNTTTYYRTQMEKIGIHPEDIKKLDDLKQLPFVNKDVIKEKKEDMISGGYQKHRLYKSYTGGTSGTQTSFYRDRKCTAKKFGRQLGILENCGYSIGGL